MSNKALKASKSSHRFRPRFSLRFFLLVIVVLGAVSGWAGTRYQRYRRDWEKRDVFAKLYRMGFTSVTNEEFEIIKTELGLKNATSPGSKPFAPLAKEDWQLLRRLNKLEELYLVRTGITNDELANIADLQQLRLLMISDPVGDEGLIHLKKLTNLRSLDLGGTRISDEGISMLQDLPSLSSLSLSYTAISDDAIQHLEKLQSLRILYVKNTRLTQLGVRQLKVRLPECRVTDDEPGGFTFESVRWLYPEVFE